MILLDTTVLVYAVGSEHPLRDSCREVIAAIGDGRLAATTTVEVIQELAHMRARRRGRADAVSVAINYTALLSPLLVVDGDDLAEGLRIFAGEGSLGSFDAVLAAVARRREHITGLLSADTAFAAVDGVVHIDPAQEGFGSELGL